MPVGKTFPLESNMHQMGGISFDKGCYLGQELVTRTYHTGQIRKRILTLRALPGYLSDKNVCYYYIVETEN